MLLLNKKLISASIEMYHFNNVYLKCHEILEMKLDSHKVLVYKKAKHCSNIHHVSKKTSKIIFVI